MSARTALVIGLWASLVVGAVQLFDGNIVHAAYALAVFGGGLLVTRAVVVAQIRWRRLRSWPRPGDGDEFPAGPRRVLLTEAGFARPE
jgi:hypothetical protein